MKLKEVTARLLVLESEGKEAHFHADGHWDIFLDKDGTCSWSYHCCDSEYCTANDWEEYDSVGLLMSSGIFLEMDWENVQ